MLCCLHSRLSSCVVRVCGQNWPRAMRDRNIWTEREMPLSQSSRLSARYVYSPCLLHCKAHPTAGSVTYPALFIRPLPPPTRPRRPYPCLPTHRPAQLTHYLPRIPRLRPPLDTRDSLCRAPPRCLLGPSGHYRPLACGYDDWLGKAVICPSELEGQSDQYG